MIDILLATYNGGTFLEEQFKSLKMQTCQEFRVLIRDGGSTDDTLQIIDRYCQEDPQRRVFLGSEKSGAMKNFSALLQASDAELIMFSDQDDVWLPEKVEKTLSEYRMLSSRNPADTPILIFSDSRIVSEDLDEIAPSMFRYQKLQPEKFYLSRMILQNVVSGNTMLMNRALADLALPIPENAVMHDHWIALVAAAFGKVGCISEPTVLYRQHRNNVYGAGKYSLKYFINKAREGRKRILARFYQDVAQARSFLECYREKLNAGDRMMFEDFSRFENKSFFGKRKCLLRYHIFKSGMFRNIGVFLII